MDPYPPHNSKAHGSRYIEYPLSNTCFQNLALHRSLTSAMSFLKTPLLLASIVAFVAACNPIPGSAHSKLPAANEPWAHKTCSGQINNAETPTATRWEAADAGDAWNAVMLAWNQEPVPAGDNSLNFSGDVGNFFRAKDQLACGNTAENPCDDTIACTDVDKPAGYAPFHSKIRILRG